MFDRTVVIILTLLAGAMWTLTFALVAAINGLSPRIDAAIEAVAIIEDAAQHIQDDMQILHNIANREECYANRGEWLDEVGCFLEEVQ